MYQATLLADSMRFEVAANEAILSAGLRAGARLRHACRRGTCGTCKARLESGQVVQDLHRPVALSTKDAGEGHVLLCCARALSDVLIDAEQADIALEPPPRRMPARVVDIQQASADVVVLSLRPPASESFTWSAGQYVGIVGPDGYARPFSIANAQRPDRSIELHVGLVAGGAVTGMIHQGLAVGSLLRIETPQGTTRLPAQGDRPLLAVVGGTGYAPLQAGLEEWLSQASTRSLHIYWGSRKPEGLYALEKARSLVSKLGNARLVPVVSDPVPVQSWLGRRGFVHRAAMDDGHDLSNCDAFVCGSPALVEAARSDFLSAGLPPDRFQADTFRVAEPV